MSGLSYTISQITEELSTDECKRLSYLCGDLDPDRFSADPRGTLHTLLSQTRVDGVFLMELVLKIKRYDLLREVLSTSKSSVEGMLRTRQAVSEYRSLMADVSEDMDAEDLKSLSFLLRGTLPKQKLENVQSFLDIVVELEKLDQLSSEKTGFIEGCLRSIHRTDLARKISRFQHTAVMANPEVCPPERAQHFRPPTAHTSSGFSSGFSSGSCKGWQTHKFCDTQTPVKKEAPRSGSGYQEEVYRMTDPRGVCLIIDCVGTEGDDLEQAFLALRFSVTLHRLLSERELESTLRAVSRQQELHTAGVFVCCIISRSRSSLLLATDPLAPGLSLDALRTLFTPRSCPGLAGKPKLFFIQSYEECEACVGLGDGELETDGPVSLCRSRAVPEDADVFWSHCWTDGHQLETPGHRSVYLQALRATLTDTRKRTHLIDMHTAVNRAVYEHNRRSAESSYTINLRHTLRKTLYLS